MKIKVINLKESMETHTGWFGGGRGKGGVI